MLIHRGAWHGYDAVIARYAEKHEARHDTTPCKEYRTVFRSKVRKHFMCNTHLTRYCDCELPFIYPRLVGYVGYVSETIISQMLDPVL
jgi:hypothetical protein